LKDGKLRIKFLELTAERREELYTIERKSLFSSKVSITRSLVTNSVKWRLLLSVSKWPAKSFVCLDFWFEEGVLKNCGYVVTTTCGVVYLLVDFFLFNITKNYKHPHCLATVPKNRNK